MGLTGLQASAIMVLLDAHKLSQSELADALGVGKSAVSKVSSKLLELGAVISRRKVYVYLDTTRGIHHRYGGKNVSGCGTGDRVWNPCIGGVRHRLNADAMKKPSAKLADGFSI